MLLKNASPKLCYFAGRGFICRAHISITNSILKPKVEMHIGAVLILRRQPRGEGGQKSAYFTK